ncbi:MAG: isoaspartyl peptidase/L-asparaginase [Desulfurococcaceae archaeon TW002]
MEGVLVVHCGAGTWRSIDEETIKKVILDALKRGTDILVSGGSALDAVVEATMSLEDSGVLNAGLGSVPDLRGVVSMDAGVMDGWSSRAGAVAAVTYPKNPVLLARKILELTDHVLLAGSAADELATRLGLPKHPGLSERVKKRYEEVLKKASLGDAVFRKSFELAQKLGYFDTVGAVALDSEGKLAAAVSTGGVILKFPGRVGDSAIPGAGFYANRYGAAVATGIGETIIMSMLSFRAVNLISEGYLADTAARLAIQYHTSMYGKDTAGLITLDYRGNAYGTYNTQAMPWGYAKTGTREVVISGLKKP